MPTNIDIVKALWLTVDQKKWADLADFFTEDAKIYWPNTKEEFSVSEFITVNQNYPGDWRVKIEHLDDYSENTISIITVSDGIQIYRAVSLFTIEQGKIIKLKEFWALEEEPPDWRQSN